MICYNYKVKTRTSRTLHKKCAKLTPYSTSMKTRIITGCERYNMLFAVGGIAQRLRWDHYIDLGGLDNDLGGIDNDLACRK